jgi:hypothetical protein
LCLCANLFTSELDIVSPEFPPNSPELLVSPELHRNCIVSPELHRNCIVSPELCPQTRCSRFSICSMTLNRSLANTRYAVS